MQAITFYTFCPLNSAYACRVAPFPAVFALRNAWIHDCALNSGNVPSYIKPSVDKGFGFGATLSIPNVNPYNCHVRLWRDLDYSGS